MKTFENKLLYNILSIIKQICQVKVDADIDCKTVHLTSGHFNNNKQYRGILDLEFLRIN